MKNTNFYAYKTANKYTVYSNQLNRYVGKFKTLRQAKDFINSCYKPNEFVIKFL